MEGINMKKRIICSILAGVLAVSMIAGCSSGNRGTNKTFTDAAPEETVEMFAGSVVASAGDYAKYDYGFEMEDSEYFSNGVTGAAGTGGVIVNDVTVDPAKGRLLIRTVSITAETKELSTVKADVENLVKALGGYIENSSMSGTGTNKDLRTIYYTVRVPADQLALSFPL